MWGMLLGALSTAWAVEARIEAVEGLPLAGEAVPIELLLLDGARPAAALDPTVVARAGDVVGPLTAVSPGRWSLRYRAPAGVVEDGLQVTLDDRVIELTLPVLLEPEPALALPAVLTGLTGRATELALGGVDAALAARLVVVATEGKAAIEPTPAGAILRLQPGPEPFARAVPVAVLDPDDARRPPAFTVLRLTGRPRIPIQVTEPGTRVTLEVGGRRYGPFEAGADGIARTSAEVRPGESVAEVLLEDLAGNSQRSSVALGGDQRPAILAIGRAAGPSSERGAVVEVFAVDARGRPWRGPSPTCGTSVGQSVDLAALSPGRWRGAVPSPPQGAFFDLRVDCSLADQATASARVPVGAPRPARLTLQAWPPELSAEAPRAQVQAFLESATGERLAAEGITVSAELGRLSVESATPGAALRASYDGTAAVAAGGDHLSAAWSAAPGAGPPRAVSLGVDWPAPDAPLVVRARALDGQGRALAGVPVTLTGEGVVLELSTEADGWASAAFRPPSRPGPARISARAAGAERSRLVLPRESTGGVPGEPDLQASLTLPIRAGRVRSVFLSTEPRSLPAVPGQTARVVVRLVDDQGNPVTDEALQLEATAGVVTRARRRPDGAYEATWAPPPGMPYGDVRITVTSARGAFSATTTELEVVPQVVRRAPGVQVGWLAGQAGLSSPYVGIVGDLQVPRLGARVYLRASVGLYGERIETIDEVSGAALSLDIDVLPVGLGLLARQDRGRLSGWLGGEGLAVPYQLEARYGDAVASEGVAIAPPGVRAFTGGGWRLRGSELTAELAYTFVTMNAAEVGWQGAVGGLQATAGYRVLFR